MLTLFTLIPIVGFLLLAIASTYKEAIHKLKSVILCVITFALFLSLTIYIYFDYSCGQFQFVQDEYKIGQYNIYLGIDGLCLFFVLLTIIIMPISLISNWKSIKNNIIYYLALILVLNTLLVIVFLVLDTLLFYIYFESILGPLFILIGVYGSLEKTISSFYFFLYTLFGSLFMLLSIITIISLIGTAYMDLISKENFLFYTQSFMFYGVFIAFAIKTPIIYFNSWLLKAHVESPLTGSIVLAGIVLKLSLYGILRIILPLLPKASTHYTYIIFIIGVLTILYASLSTIKTEDIKELIAYSSVCHAAVYLLGVFSNIIQGICGGILLGLAHGFVSPGLFICAGGVLYDRCHTRSILYYKGLSQLMPLFSILFFLLCLGNCGAPLTLNFLGEFLSLYGVFERLPFTGILASSSIIFSAGYTIFMFNRISFAGTIVKGFLNKYISDLNKRETSILLILVIFTISLGIQPAFIVDGIIYDVNNLIYLVCYDFYDISNH